MADVTWSLEEDPLDIPAALQEVSREDCGAVASFIGTVRVTAAAPGNEGRAVVGLEYEAHPALAEESFSSIAAEASEKWDIKAVAARHRIGRCGLGAPTVVVACSAPHRADALEACRFFIDELKARVPIFKKELYEDGTAWMGVEGG